MKTKENFYFIAKILVIMTLLISTVNLKSNNLIINVDSVTIHPSDTQRIMFTVSWDQSWRTNTSPYNWDGVWLFVKLKNCASGTWEHCKLSPTFTDHIIGNPLEIDTSFSLKDGLGHAIANYDSNGVMLRRISADTGNISGVAVSLKLVNIALGDHDYKVFGIEMVYIPSGEFYLGDGGTTTVGTFRYGATDLDGLVSTNAIPRPYLVESENAITSANSLNNLWSIASTPENLPANYPKGYQDFYCMKYEMSQGQYAEFLNTLDNAQASERYFVGSANRYTIGGTWPNLAATAQYRAMNYMSWYDLCAYLDWACLRPMTELEYEKVARGMADPVLGEYSWGNTGIVRAYDIVAGTDGQYDERVQDFIILGSGIANHLSGVAGPLRCGFASSPTSTRLQAGAGFYGVMELTGNVYDFCVNANEAAATTFTRKTGNGVLTSVPPVGFADVASWPSQAAGVLGACARGGAWSSGILQLRTSNRNYVTNASLTMYGRANTYGGRGVR